MWRKNVLLGIKFSSISLNMLRWKCFPPKSCSMILKGLLTCLGLGKVRLKLYQTIPVNSMFSRNRQPDGVCLCNMVWRIDISRLQFRYSASFPAKSVFSNTNRQCPSLHPSLPCFITFFSRLYIYSLNFKCQPCVRRHADAERFGVWPVPIVYPKSDSGLNNRRLTETQSYSVCCELPCSVTSLSYSG